MTEETDEDSAVLNGLISMSESDVEAEPLFGLTDTDIEEILEALNSGYEEAIVEKLATFSASESAELLGKISEESRRTLLTRHGPAFDPQVFVELDPELRRQCLPLLTPQQVAAIISDLDSDDALNLILDLDSDFQKDVIRFLSAKTRLDLTQGLNFPEESAGRLMQRELVAIPQYWTVGKTIDYLRAAADELPDSFLDIFVVSPTYKVVGEIPLNRLVCAKRSVKLDDLKLEDIHPVLATMDQEDVARMFQDENITSAPVVDDEGRLIGVITIDDVVDVINEEVQEDLLKLGGVGQSDLYSSTISTTWYRFRWLFINLWTAILAAGVVALFESTIEEVVALAILMPIVASMGGNAGTQALTIAVRALASRELSGTNAVRIIAKETAVGTLNGVGFAIIMGLIAGFWFHDHVLGLVIGAAMIINLFFAGLFGAGIPILLHKMGSDPAVSSAIFLTTITDVVGFFAFLGLAAVFLI